MVATESKDPGNRSPDSSDRIEDFLSRHGGAAARGSAKGDIVPGASGWSEVYAADGYTLRCEWSQIGDRQQMRFTENPPRPSG
jgi:hypothetical protein